MAKGRIEKGDIVQEGILKDFNKEILETSKNITTLELAMKSVQETAKKSKKDFSTIKPKDVKTIDQFNALTEKSNKNAENRIQINKQLLTEKEKLSKAQREQNKAIKIEVALGDKQINTLEKLRARNQAIKIAKDKVNFSTKKGQDAIKKLNAELNRNNKILDLNASKLGKLKNNIGNYKSALSGLGTALGITAGVAGLVSVFKGAFNTVKNFEQSIANLSAITGATGKDLDFLKNKAIELGKVTTLSASQVAEGFKIIASAKPELLQDAKALAEVTKQTITLAEAAGIELPEAATAVTNALNQFGAGADEAAKFVDVLAAGSKFGAGDINFLNEAMVNVGTIAASAGLGIQETVGALELLAEKGLPASKAGNQLKNVLLNLQKEGKGFVNGKFNLQAAIAQVGTELNDIQDPAKKAAAEMKLFGKENLVAGQTLLDNKGKLAEMTEAVDENGIAIEQQAKNNDTLSGAIKSLGSQYEAWILKSSEAGGVVDGLKWAIQGLANNFETIVSVLVTVVRMFVTFKLAMKALEIHKQIGGLKGLGAAFKSIGKGAQGATKGAKKLGKALKGIGFGLVVTAGLELLKLLWDLASGTAELRRQEDLLAAAREVSTKSVEKVLEPINKQIDAEKKLLEIQLAKGELKGGQLEFEEKLKALEDKKLKRLEHERNLRARQVFDLKKANELIEAEKKTRTVNADDFSASESGQNSYANAIDRVNRANAESNRQIQKNLDLIVFKQTAEKAFQTEIDTTSDTIHDYTVNITSNTLEKRKGTGATKDSTDAIELETLAMEIENTTIEESIRKLHELRTAKEDVLTTFEDSERATLTRNVQEAEYNLLTADENISNKKKNELLKEQIIAKAELEKLGATGIEQQLIDARAQKEINALTRESIDLAKMRREALEFTSDLAVKLIDERIKKLDEETEAHKKQAETLKTLAENGSIEAKESIAEENRLIAENEQKKAEQEKRKQRILLVTSVLQAYNANMEAGQESGEALTNAITSKAVMDQFIASIGSAYEGTEDTGKASNPLDSNGGRIMLLHDNERVMTAKQNAMLGGVSNDYVAQVMEQHRMGNYMDGAQLVGKIDNAELVTGLSSLKTEMSEVKKAILNQPRESNNTAEMLSNYMVLENHKTQGGKRTTSRFKVQ